jgi:hypothetical protein
MKEKTTVSTVLYVNSSGKNVTHTSYSSRSTFKKCPRQFKLERIDGWSDKVMRAAPLFGRCIESGLTAYEESGRAPNAGVKVFQRLWEEVKLTPEFDKLIYTATEVSYDGLLKSGTEMMLLYECKAPHLPIVKPVFQQRIRKTIFPGTNLAALENVAVLDILSFPPWDHRLLPKIDEPPLPNDIEEFHGPRELIIDIKTSGKDFPTDLVALDPQLAEYAWQTRIPDVAFLWFVKVGHGLKRGSRISLLKAHRKITLDADKHPIHEGPFWAGWEGLVIDTGEPDAEGRMWVYIGDCNALNEYEAVIKPLRGKAREAAEKSTLDKLRDEGRIIAVSDLDVTKQKIQFAAARLSEEDMDEVGRGVAQTTVEMVRAHESDFYEKQPGVRFPNEKCGFCSMKWICLHRSEERDKQLTKRGEEWLDSVDGECE